MIGARLKPGAAAALFEGPADTFTDRVTPLDQIVGDVADALRGHRLEASDDAERFAIFERFLQERLQPQRPGLDLVLEAVAHIEAAAGSLSIADLSSALNVSHKHLIQQFTAHIGLRPKQFARVVRFSSLLPALTGAGAPDWAALAQQAGYHDQSHFNREFQSFSGLSPRQYLKLREAYQLDYNTNDDTRFVPIG